MAYSHTLVRPDHHLVVVNESITYGRLARAYAHDLPTWARVRLFGVIGQPDPVDDPAGHLHTRWWEPDWPVTPTSIRILEQAAPEGLVTPWLHDWLSPPA